MFVLRSLGIATQVAVAAKMYPGIIAPAIIAGTLAGCGGKVLCDVFESISGLRHKFEIARPSFVLRSAVVNSAVFYVLVYMLQAFTVSEGTGLILALNMLYTLTSDIIDTPIDYTESVTNVFTTITLVALPSTGAKRKPETRGRGSATEETAPKTPRSTRKRSTSARR